MVIMSQFKNKAKWIFMSRKDFTFEQQISGKTTVSDRNLDFTSPQPQNTLREFEKLSVEIQ